MVSIGVVSRQLGVEVGTLRQWENRYQFPRPERHPKGQRHYSDSEVALLRQVVLRVRAGERVGGVIKEILAAEATNADSESRLEGDFETIFASLTPREVVLFEALIHHPARYYQQMEQARLSFETLLEFIEQCAAPLAQAVGDAWAKGLLSVHLEHLFTSHMECLLNRALHPHPFCAGQQSLLLATLSGEGHTLGLKMFHTVLLERGIPCTLISSSLPVEQIIDAARLCQPAIVALSISLAYPKRAVDGQLQALSRGLSPQCEIWLGGAGAAKVVQLPSRCRRFYSVTEAIEALEPLVPLMSKMMSLPEARCPSLRG
ncbi:MerR family transcriptional regulator [Ectothiorhodospiraceae bacterium BW-2]|nr:MerR family transcriptional regulator [Ectothiorhodospiraceae bacterium BW-2]